MAPEDDDSPWTRQLIVGLGALVLVALVVGAVVSVVALGAAKLTGLGSAGGSPSRPATLFMPTGQPTTSPQHYPDPHGSSGSAPASGSPSASAGAPASSSPSESAGRRPKAITLQSYPAKVAPGQRVNLTGVYQSGEGATLQVQRFENGGWTDFPTTASVRGGIFTTYVMTGRVGMNRFRVLDPSSGRSSNPVRVRVG
jgi:hypothetical protein